jgi:hypothetical protein
MSSGNAGKPIAWLVVIAASCTPMFGLDVVAVDSDGDGIPDDRDVCPHDYDPAQRDSDFDGIGDACGACGATTVDLDEDGRDDACDGCIGPGVIGVDADNDGIDDGCDPCVNGVSVSAVDTDRDGIPDGCDPCIGIGIDFDDDGVDDACDVCLLGDDHDEDGDGYPNGCDVCPADYDPDQGHAAGETVGTACDPWPDRVDTRRLFDGFDREQPGVWLGLPGFAIRDGALHVEGGGLHRSFYEVRDDFVLRTRVQFGGVIGVTTARLGLRVSVGLVGFGGLGDGLSCTIDAMGALSAGQNTAFGTIDTSGGVELRIVRERIDDENQVRCEAIDANGVTVIGKLFIHGDELDISLVADQGVPAWFEWVEAIDHPRD